jgi:hypothetical protein
VTIALTRRGASFGKVRRTLRNGKATLVIKPRRQLRRGRYVAVVRITAAKQTTTFYEDLRVG